MKWSTVYGVRCAGMCSSAHTWECLMGFSFFTRLSIWLKNDTPKLSYLMTVQTLNLTNKTQLLRLGVKVFCAYTSVSGRISTPSNTLMYSSRSAPIPSEIIFKIIKFLPNFYSPHSPRSLQYLTKVSIFSRNPKLFTSN